MCIACRCAVLHGRVHAAYRDLAAMLPDCEERVPFAHTTAEGTFSAGQNTSGTVQVFALYLASVDSADAVMMTDRLLSVAEKQLPRLTIRSVPFT